MALTGGSSNGERMPAGLFATTHWSVVLAARQPDAPGAASALEQLCSTYWYPLYAYVRRRGFSAEDAQDLTQGFFAHLLSKDFLSGVGPEKGKFRSFLLACLKHFLADEWRKAHRGKRGGVETPLPLEPRVAEGRYRLEPVETLDAESLYERRWAMTLLDQVLARLREQWSAAGKQSLFNELEGELLEEDCADTYAQKAAKLGLTEGAVKMAMHRLREQYKELFRLEIAHTVAEPQDIEEEMRHLFAVISR